LRKEAFLLTLAASGVALVIPGSVTSRSLLLASLPVAVAMAALFHPELRLVVAVVLLLWSILATFIFFGPLYWLGTILMFVPERGPPDADSQDQS
jgi:hypothetical protein